MLKLKKLYQGVLWIAVLLLCILALCNVVPRLFGIQPYIVLSGSMEPILPTGSIVYMNQKIAPSDAHTGDIISYIQGDIMITHRIIDESSSSVITKGDANEQADISPVSRSSISGKYVFHIPYLGYIYAQLTKPVFYLCLAGYFILQVIISNLIPAFGIKQTHQTSRKETSL